MTSRILLAHHWFFEPRGGERVLAELAALFPAAPILTAFAATDVSGWPEEIANLLVYLAADESSFVTGAEMVIDGGLSAQ